MSDMSQVLSLLQEFRGEVREDFKEVKEEVKEVRSESKEGFRQVNLRQDKTNGNVIDHRDRLTAIETNEKRDNEGKKRWKDFVPTAVGIAISCSLSILIYGVLLAH